MMRRRTIPEDDRRRIEYSVQVGRGSLGSPGSGDRCRDVGGRSERPGRGRGRSLRRHSRRPCGGRGSVGRRSAFTLEESGCTEPAEPSERRFHRQRQRRRSSAGPLPVRASSSSARFGRPVHGAGPLVARASGGPADEVQELADVSGVAIHLEALHDELGHVWTRPQVTVEARGLSSLRNISFQLLPLGGIQAGRSTGSRTRPRSPPFLASGRPLSCGIRCIDLLPVLEPLRPGVGPSPSISRARRQRRSSWQQLPRGSMSTFLPERKIAVRWDIICTRLNKRRKVFLECGNVWQVGVERS